MKDKRKIDVNKLILITMIIFMILPYTITICGVSMFKIATIVIIIMFMYLFNKNVSEKKVLLRNKFIFMNLFFSLTIIISLIVNYSTISFNDFFEVFRYIIYALVTAIIIIICKEKEYLIFGLKAISIVMTIVCIFGIIQYFDVFSINKLYIKLYAPTQYVTLINDYPTPRIVGTKANPSVYGVLLSIGVYLNLLYYKYAKNKTICVLSIILCLINLIMTLTRTIQLAFICSIIMYVVVNVWTKYGARKAAKAMIFTILFVSIIIIILPKDFTWRFVQIFDLTNTNSWIARIEKWKDYLLIIKDNFIIGIGPVKNYIRILGYVDSELIQIIMQYGIIGVGAYLLMLLSPIYIYIKEKSNISILKYYLPILVLVIINNIASSSLIQFDTAIVLYIIIGFIFSDSKNDKEIKE